MTMICGILKESRVTHTIKHQKGIKTMYEYVSGIIAIVLFGVLPILATIIFMVVCAIKDRDWLPAVCAAFIVAACLWLAPMCF